MPLASPSSDKLDVAYTFDSQHVMDELLSAEMHHILAPFPCFQVALPTLGQIFPF